MEFHAVTPFPSGPYDSVPDYKPMGPAPLLQKALSMRVLWLLLLLSIVGAALHYKYAYHYDSDATAHHGFVALPKVVGFDESTVMVVAAENCPHEAAQRADRLAQQLRDQGIRVLRTDEVRFNPAHIDRALMERVPSVMEGAQPIVFIHGRAKGNPALDDVVAEYQAPND
jgi:hypothetical protein